MKHLLLVVSALLFCVAASVLLGDLPPDAGIFLAVGRGFLNGKPLYTGLFETKPPGIFVLSAVAHILGGVVAAKVLCLLGLLLVIGICTRLEGRRGFVVGVLMSCFIILSAGPFYSETVGVCLLFLYLLRRNLILLTISLFLPIFLKEPFVLPCLALGILLNKTGFLRFYVLPQFLAGMLFLVALLLLGCFSSYFTLYLPFMLSVRVGTASNTGPIPLLLWVMRLFPLLPLLLFPAFRADPLRSGIALLLAGASTLIGGFDGQSAVFLAPILAWLLLQNRFRWAIPVHVLCILPLLLVLYHLPSSDPHDRVMARRIDQIMDACGYHEYAHLGTSSPYYGLTRHSPTGPLLFLEYYTLQQPHLVSETLRRLPTADLIVFRRTASALMIQRQFYDLTEPIVVRGYTTKPPPCAGEGYQDDLFVLLYRK
jgi:hypothetical protein